MYTKAVEKEYSRQDTFLCIISDAPSLLSTLRQPDSFHTFLPPFPTTYIDQLEKIGRGWIFRLQAIHYCHMDYPKVIRSRRRVELYLSSFPLLPSASLPLHVFFLFCFYPLLPPPS